ncbi:MAG: type IX secretion system sortase PorU [Paludibacteraceae bacterium]|nr:type IX secretion system sortase PorU [Paludibacteraceae bacterium]
MKHRALSILFFLLLGIGVFGSESNLSKTSYTIQWKGISIQSPSTEKILVFDESISLDASKLPYISKIFSIENNQSIDSVSIQNIVLGDFTDEEKQLITSSLVAISEKISATIDYTIDRKQKKAVISFIPIIKQNGILKKVIAFDLVYQTTTTPTLRAATAGLHHYADHSVLETGKWIKISVPESGIYKITYEDLVKWGISNPANAHIFGYGGAMLPEDFQKSKIDDLPQLSVFKEKGSDGVFNAGDYILFYAQGPTSWSYNSSGNKFTRALNPYSFYGYYFITSDVGVEKLISTKTSITDAPTKSVDYFLDHQIHEKEAVNICSSGQEWYGEVFSTTSNYSFSFDFPNICYDKQATVQIDAAGSSSTVTTMSVYENSQSLGSLTFAQLATEDMATPGSATYQFTPASTALTIKTAYNNTSSGTAWLNYIVLSAYRYLTMTDNSMFFRNPDVVGSSNFAQYNITGASGLSFWNITNPANIQQLPTSYNNSIYSFVDSASTLQEYVAVNTSASFSSPTLVGTVSNQDLHAITQADLVIITHPDYMDQAKILANKHIQQDGLSVLIVTPTQIYNEFSSGTPDATAYRWLMKMLYDRNSASTAPKYLLLFGDGTYDNRAINAVNSSVNKLLTYQAGLSLNATSSYVTDDYFALLDDTEGSNIPGASMDIGVGRLPASSTTEATNVVNKIITYTNNDLKGVWKNYLAFIGDDADTNGDIPFTYQTDSLAKYIEKYYPNYQTKRFLLDAYTQEVSASTESYPLAKEQILNLIKSGALLIDYVGHGSSEGLASEKIITRADIANMYNKRYPFFVTATCNFSRFDQTNSSSGEDLLLNANGGAIGLFSAARTVWQDSNYFLNKYFNNYVLKIENGQPLGLGEISRRAKNKYSGNANKLSYMLLGDPALKLTIPLNKVVTDTIITNINSDTIKALTTVTLKGEIQNLDGNLLSNFNGIVTLTVYDKKETITTLGNNAGKKYNYTDRPNTLFTGRARVANGKFTTIFIIPKDINYSYGTGRINYYAADTVNNLEANGYNENFIIGGTNSNFEFENNGPIINMYLNSTNFKSGNTVDATSVFYAQLSDKSGINTGSSGIGHDLLLTLNNDSSYVLNDYYESSLDDYKSGAVAYTLPTLSNGTYTLSLRAWDILDNSSTGIITFKVDNTKSPDIYDLYAAPNPATSYVNFILKHDQPESILTLKVEVFDLAGQLLWNNSATSYADSSTTEIYWDLKTSNGKINPGIYIYRISVETKADGVVASKANKLIVK